MMNKFILGLSVSALSTVAMAGPMMAQTASSSSWWFWNWLRPITGGGGNTTPVAVPEIDASTGLLALAAVAAALLFVWERRRRAS